MSFREHKGAIKCPWWLLLFLIWHGVAGDWPKKPPMDHWPLRWCAKKTQLLGCSNLQSFDSWKLRIQETLRNAAGLGATIWVGRRMENGGIKFDGRSNFEKGTCNHWRILWWYRRLVSCWDGFLTSASLVPRSKWLAKDCKWSLLFCVDKGLTSLNQIQQDVHSVIMSIKDQRMKPLSLRHILSCVCVCHMCHGSFGRVHKNLT